MEEYNRIDKLFHESVESFEMNPGEKSWNDLDKELERKRSLIYKKKADRFKWLSLILALLLISFFSYEYIISPGGSVHKGNQASNNISVSDKSSDAVVNENKNESNQNVPGSKIDNEKSINIRDNSEQTKNETRTLKATEQNITASKKVKQRTNQASFALIADNKIRKNKTVHQQNQNSFADKGNNNNENVNRDKGLTEEGIQASSSISTKQTIQESNNINSKDEVEAGNKANLTTQRTDGSKPVISQTDIALKTETKSGSDSLATKKCNVMSHFSIAAFYSPNYTSSFLIDKDAGDNEDISEYKDREKTEYTFSTGLLIGYNISHNWSVHAGCNYSTMKYSMNYSKIYVRYGFDNQLHYQYPTSCGIVELPISGSKVYHDGDSLNVNIDCNQTVKFLNVPVNIRYGIKKNHVTWFADAGLSFNFILQEHMKLNFGSKEIEITGNADGLKKNNMGYMVGAGLQYNFSKGIGIFMEPSFRGSITSVTENIGVNCYPYSVGLYTGLSYHF